MEAGHRCSIPTCRYIEVDVHHIVPWSQCKAHEYDNLIALCPNCHRRADAGDIDRKSLRLYKLNLRFVHDKFSQLEMDILFDLYKLPTDAAIAWLPLVLILLKRILDAKYVEFRTGEAGVFVNGVQASHGALSLTAKGRAFIDDLGLEEF